MNIEDIPFNHHIGVTKSSLPDYRLEIDSEGHHLNHLGTVHGSVLFSLAEASSGDFLLDYFRTTGAVAMIVRSNAKYSDLAKGVIRSRILTGTEELEKARKAYQNKGKAMVEIAVQIVGEDDTQAAEFSFQWFLTRSPSAKAN